MILVEAVNGNVHQELSMSFDNSRSIEDTVRHLKAYDCLCMIITSRAKEVKAKDNKECIFVNYATQTRDY